MWRRRGPHGRPSPVPAERTKTEKTRLTRSQHPSFEESTQPRMTRSRMQQSVVERTRYNRPALSHPKQTNSIDERRKRPCVHGLTKRSFVGKPPPFDVAPLLPGRLSPWAAHMTANSSKTHPNEHPTLCCKFALMPSLLSPAGLTGIAVLMKSHRDRNTAGCAPEQGQPGGPPPTGLRPAPPQR